MVGCATSYAAAYKVRGPAAQSVTSGDVEAVERIGAALAAEFDLKRSKDDPPDLVEMSRQHGYRVLFEYTSRELGPTRPTLLHAEVQLSGSYVRIGILDLGASGETEPTRALRLRLEELIEQEFSGRQIESKTGVMDTSFAP